MSEDFEIAITDAPPADADIRRVARELGLPVVPPEWIVWLKHVDALWIDARETWWPNTVGGGPAFIFLRGLQTFGVGTGLPPMLDWATATAEFREHSGTNLVPCLRVTHDADYWCFTSSGSLMRWSHDRADAAWAPSCFLDLVEHELAQLRERAKLARRWFAERRTT